MASVPTGTVTFLFTDVEGSTKMWERDQEAMRGALARHDGILRGAIEANGGFVFKTVGDAFCAAFDSATDALEAALDVQRALFAESWKESCTIRARVALHTGAAEERDGDYFGPPVNRVARLLSAGYGGQTLLSGTTRGLVVGSLPQGTELRDLGERHLKDLLRPERVSEVLAPGLPSGFPPLKTLDARRNNLPAQPTPLVGRGREVGEVCGRLRQEGVRLLTLTGPGGTGKTRLALQAAADLLEEYEGGVFFVALDTLTDPELFLSAVARVLELREVGDVALPDLLKEYLGRRELLLVLDNFEQVLGAAPLAGELLSAAPRVKVLATSRVPLGVYGEHEYAVPPLSLPDPKRLPPVAILRQYEAVRLFIERAQAAKAGFAITNENAPAIAEICVRLDGLPLAIELAAARVKMLPPKALLTRLSDRLKLLTGGAKDLPARQRTLRGAIDWSHDLLDEAEKVLFRRLAVFFGGRTLEAIEAVCDAGGDLPVGALDGVSSLLDKSLIRQREGPGDEPRFVMLETIHEYARERLEESSGEAGELSRLHAEYFLALAEGAEPQLVGPDQVEWMDRLEAEHGNLRAALSWSLGSGEAETALGLSGALWWFWYTRGHWSEGRRWLEEALTEGAVPPCSLEARAKVLAGFGRIALEVGERERARALLEESVRLYRGTRDERGLAEAVDYLGIAISFGGEFEEAKPLFEESLALYRRAGDGWGVGEVLNNLALVANLCGQEDESMALHEDSLASRREAGDKRGIAMSLGNLGQIWYDRGEYDRATKLLEESLALSRELGEKALIGINLTDLGETELERGKLEQARSYLEEGFALSKDLGQQMYTVFGILVFARLAEKRGEPSRAARLFGFTMEAPEAAPAQHLATSSSRAHVESSIASARARIDDAAWKRAWEEGRAMTLGDAVAYALEEGADD